MRTLFALSLLSLFACSCAGGGMPEGLPSLYEFRYSGTMQYPIEWYRVETAEDGTLRILSSHGEADILVVRAPEDLLQRIDRLARQYKLYRLKENYQPSFDVWDGNSWSLRIRYSDSFSISSHGYHVWPPKKLRAGMDAINQLLREVVDNAREEDILGHESH